MYFVANLKKGFLVLYCISSMIRLLGIHNLLLFREHEEKRTVEKKLYIIYIRTIHYRDRYFAKKDLPSETSKICFTNRNKCSISLFCHCLHYFGF